MATTTTTTTTTPTSTSATAATSPHHPEIERILSESHVLSSLAGHAAVRSGETREQAAERVAGMIRGVDSGRVVRFASENADLLVRLASCLLDSLPLDPSIKDAFASTLDEDALRTALESPKTVEAVKLVLASLSA